MSNPLGKLLKSVKDSVLNSGDRQKQSGSSPADLVETITDLLGGNKNEEARPGHGGHLGNVKPASQDPYGDPADERKNIKPASEDPYGDPADEGKRGR